MEIIVPRIMDDSFTSENDLYSRRNQYLFYIDTRRYRRNWIWNFSSPIGLLDDTQFLTHSKPTPINLSFSVSEPEPLQTPTWSLYTTYVSSVKDGTNRPGHLPTFSSRGPSGYQIFRDVVNRDWLGCWWRGSWDGDPEWWRVGGTPEGKIMNLVELNMGGFLKTWTSRETDLIKRGDNRVSVESEW